MYLNVIIMEQQRVSAYRCYPGTWDDEAAIIPTSNR